ncbi:MAG: HD domain-containing protein [Anaerolineae bacterium]|jgi:metal-dependent HD superfamily phosphatase/phosphodiesterase|nr:HD domain-containing protein [Chloroflexota bacterium]
MNINVPTRHNEKLRELLTRINADEELAQLYVSANMNAVNRSRMSDHGEVHIRIVANAALRLLRLLVEAQVTPNIISDYEMGVDDAEVVVVLAACLHDVGISIHREDHEHHSLVIAYPKARQLLADLYKEPQRTIMTSEVLHAIIAHNWEVSCLTLEAGVVKVADALDMKQGRSRIPFEAGSVNIHSVSAMEIQEVHIERGEERPIRIAIDLASSAGIFQVDELLQRKLRHSTLAPHVEIVARLEGQPDGVLKVYRF